MTSFELLELLDKAVLLEQKAAYEAAESVLLDALEKTVKADSVQNQILCCGHLILFLQRRGRHAESINMQKFFKVLLDVEDRGSDKS